jgi:hypothetical protein
MKNIMLTRILIVTLSTIILTTSQVEALSVYDVQYTTDPAGNSSYAGTVVDCSGGIVIHKFPGSNPKLTIYDPANANGWGGITIKDFTTNTNAFDGIAIGDWVSFTDTMVEEYRGNTQLRFDSASAFNIVSSGNPLPAPIVVSPADIAAPIYQSGPPQGWFIADHSAEIYEAMYLKIENVTVVTMGLGKANDIYALQNQFGDSCWASDYMNIDAGGPYHPLVEIGREFESVSGVLEQYTKLSSGWDYYQMLTTSTSDFVVVPEPTTIVFLAAGAVLLLKHRKK